MACESVLHVTLVVASSMLIKHGERREALGQARTFWLQEGVSAMRQVSLSKIVLALFLALSQTLPGCAVDERQAVPTETRPDEQHQVRVVPEEKREAILQDVLVDPRIQACEDLFSASGLAHEPSWTFSMEGVSTEGVSVTVTILGYLGPDSSVGGLVAYMEGNGRTGVSPCLVQSEGGSVFSVDAVLAITEYAVTREGTPVLISEGSPDSTGGPGSLNWRKFWHCVGIGTVASMLWCSGKCVTAGIVYGECFLGCLGLGELMTIFTCAIGELVDNP